MYRPNIKYRQLNRILTDLELKQLAGDMISNGEIALSIDLSRAKYQNLSFLAEYKLTHLNLSSMSKRQMESLPEMASVEDLCLLQTKAKAIHLSENFPFLKVLDIRLGSIDDLSDISKIKSLVVVELLRLRALVDLSFLSGLRNLQFLKLDQCSRISAIPTAVLSTTLRRIHLEQLNALTSILGLAECSNLEEVIIGSCPGLSASEFEQFIGTKIHVLPGIAALGSKKYEEVTSLLGKNVIEGFYGTEREYFDLK